MTLPFTFRRLPLAVALALGRRRSRALAAGDAGAPRPARPRPIVAAIVERAHAEARSPATGDGGGRRGPAVRRGRRSMR